MSKQLFAAALLLSLSLPAFAVTTKDCPAKVDVQLGSTEVSKSLEEIYNEANEDEKYEAIEKAITNLGDLYEKTFSFPLKTRASGRCVYGTKGSQEKVEVFSKNGKDLLYVQVVAGEKGLLLRTYAGIAALSTDGIKLVSGRYGAALAIPRGPYTSYEEGGPLVFIGKMDDLKLR